MKVVTSDMMRELDQRAVQEVGIPASVLMENAGRAVFEEIVAHYGPVRDVPIHVYCGPGNNGGDGFVVARYLHLAGARVTLGLVGDEAKLKGEALEHYRVLRAMNIPWQPSDPAIKVDALLGTGLKGAPRADYAEAIDCLNELPGRTVAVDVPSGLDSDSGGTPGRAVKADLTVTFGYPKLGVFLPPGLEVVGELVVRDIGFDWSTVEAESPYEWIRPKDVAGLLKRRPRNAHKGDFGHVLVIGGSIGMSGAPAMTALAAARGGAGLVTVAAPESAQRLIAAKLNEVMTVPLPEVDGALCEESFEEIRKAAERADVLCIGPGSGRNPGTESCILRVLRDIDKPVVVDADALNALATAKDGVRRGNMILTPHPGECGRLIGLSTQAVQTDRAHAAQRTSEQYGLPVVVLKGACSLVTQRGRFAFNSTGNPGMATGGSGDSLTGLIGALLAQGLESFDAAKLGTYLHGRAGDLAAAEIGETGFIAGDIIEFIPRAIRELESIA